MSDRADAWAAFDLAYRGYGALVHRVALGQETGLLAALAGGPGTAERVTERAGTDPRMTLEWLRVITVAGFADHRDGVFSPGDGLDEMVRVPGLGSPAEQTAGRVGKSGVLLRALTEAVRSGHGVPHTVYEPESSRMQDMFNLTMVSGHLLPDLLGPVPGVVDALQRGCDVLDLGCRAGWALQVLATAHPRSRYTGVDPDEHALTTARQRLDPIEAQTTLEARDTRDLPDAAYDLVLAIDVVHDLGDPVGTLHAVRRALRPGGVLVMAETQATGDFETDRHEPSAWQYQSSLAMCIPVSQHGGGPGFGSMWGRAGATPLLAEVGFGDVDVHTSPPGYAVYACRR